MDQIWLVKSGNQILGPYSSEELRALVQQRSISLIDEAKRPFERWTFIRQIEEFRDLAGAVRERQADSAEETVGLSQLTDSSDATLSITESVTQELEKTPEPWIARKKMAVQAGALLKEPRSILPVPRVREEVNFFSTKFFLSIFVLAVVGFGYFAWNKKKELQNQQKKETESLFQAARSHTERAEYDKALQLYEQLEQRGVKLSDQDKLSRLRILVHRPEMAAQALALYSNLQGLSQGSLVRDLSLLRALVLMQQKKSNEARLDLENLLRLDPEDEIAKINLAALNFFSGYLREAWQGLMDRSLSTSRAPQVALLMGWVALRWQEPSSRESVVSKALEKLGSNVVEFLFERLILKAALELESRSQEEALLTIKQIFSSDPLESNEFLVDLLLDQQILRWSEYAELCENISGAFSYQAEAKLMRIFCRFRSGKKEMAISALNEMAKSMGTLSLVQAAQISMDLRMEKGLSVEVEELKSAPADPIFVSLAFAQACLAMRNLECAESFWREALQRSPEQPQALWGLATIYRERGNQIASRDHLRRASLAAPGYLRLFELRRGGSW
jgi:Flp pilus assembly protein TadD